MNMTFFVKCQDYIRRPSAQGPHVLQTENLLLRRQLFFGPKTRVLEKMKRKIQYSLGD